MRVLELALLSSLTLAGTAVQAYAGILIQVDQSTQTISVDVDGHHLYDWRVSTGRPGYDTPNGTFTPNRMDVDHHSQEFDNAPMPYAIFFDLDGDAIHGTPEPVGEPAASHGCVRLSPPNAATLFSLVAEEGIGNTKVEIHGDVQIALQNSRSPRGTMVAGPTPRDDEDADYGEDEPYSSAQGYAQPYNEPQPQQYPPFPDVPAYGQQYGQRW